MLAAVAVLAVAAEMTSPRAADGEQGAPDGITLNVVGACPDAAEVRRLLAGLVSAEAARAAPVSVEDRGSRFRIAVREESTMLDDPARDCHERARQAAVVAASELQPRAIVLGPPVWTIEKGLVFDVAPTSAGAVWSPGAEFRGAYGSGAWSLVGAAGARGPATLSLANGWKAELLRFPLDAGARLTSYRWRLRPWVVLGASATVTGIIGQEVVQTEREWRLDLGALVMAAPPSGSPGVSASPPR
jgi:hypothetical protein